jgi:hypothetical protein
VRSISNAGGMVASKSADGSIGTKRTLSQLATTGRGITSQFATWPPPRFQTSRTAPSNAPGMGNRVSQYKSTSYIRKSGILIRPRLAGQFREKWEIRCLPSTENQRRRSRISSSMLYRRLPDSPRYAHYPRGLAVGEISQRRRTCESIGSITSRLWR